METKILYLRMKRQHLINAANESEYLQLYKDCQPVQNVYWNGFGDPPSLSFRTSFDDIEFNRKRQLDRKIIKGRFASGNIGWIVQEDLELFASLYRKPINNFNPIQQKILDLMQTIGPLNIQQIKEETGLLVKEITPALHKLQEAFLIYEDHYDGEWDRCWYQFEELFPNINIEKFSKIEALKIIIQRFAHRFVYFNSSMLKSFYKLSEKEFKLAIYDLIKEHILIEYDDGYILTSDIDILNNCKIEPMNFVYAIHRNDILYKAYEPELKEKFKPLIENLKYDHEPLQYLLIDGEFHGASLGHFRNGPYDLNDVICDLQNCNERKEEIINSIKLVNYGKMPIRFNGKELTK